jgi:large subunit ribosomal protein L4
MATSTFTKSGTKATTAAKLPKEIFELEVTSHELLKQAYLTYLANGRTNNAKTKTRGEVRGGGRKPWKQKGTGRARFGSTRNPIWRKGGVAFGPTGEENYTKRISVTSKRQAIKQALSLKNTANAVVVIEELNFKSAKVSEAFTLFNKIGAKGNTLVVVDAFSENVSRATNNLPDVHVVRADRLNVYDLLNADTILLTEKAVLSISNWLGGKK